MSLLNIRPTTMAKHVRKHRGKVIGTRDVPLFRGEDKEVVKGRRRGKEYLREGGPRGS